MQCPYCNKTRTRVDDLIRHHIVNNHPDKVAEVQSNRSLITTVEDQILETATSQNETTGKANGRSNGDGTGRKSEGKSEEKGEGTKKKRKLDDSRPTETVTEQGDGPGKKPKASGKDNHPKQSTTPKETGDRLPSESPTLFRRLEGMINDVDAPLEAEDGSGETTANIPSTEETARAVASILPKATSSTAVEILEKVANCKMVSPLNSPKKNEPKSSLLQPLKGNPGDVYVPDCETTATQYSPPQANSIIPPQLAHSSSSVPHTPPQSAKLALHTPPLLSPIPYPPSHPAFAHPKHLENHCPHGVKTPIHIHIRSKITKPNGDIIKTKEVRVNCTSCPPPVLHTIARVDQGSLRRAAGIKSPRSSIFGSENSSINQDTSSDSDSD